jgi:hypothetical protein
MLGGYIDVFENCVHRAHDLALLAIDADFRVNIKLRRAGFGVYASDGADIDASSIVSA